jgi:hypothetical protein
MEAEKRLTKKSKHLGVLNSETRWRLSVHIARQLQPLAGLQRVFGRPAQPQHLFVLSWADFFGRLPWQRRMWCYTVDIDLTTSFRLLLLF